MASQPIKRHRAHIVQQGQPFQQTQPSHFPATTMENSEFVASRFIENKVENRSRMRKALNKTPKKTFTEKQVKTLVAEAIHTHSEALRLEYDKILNDKLSEQFNTFSQFNKDYVSRQFQTDNDFSYIS